jgi:transketolase
MTALLTQSVQIGGNDLARAAAAVRGTLIEISHRGKAAHIASSLSTVDILVAAYWHALRFDPSNADDPKRDRLILSKGHAVAALYAALAHKGSIPWNVLATFNQDGSPLQEHPGPRCAPGVELATGSLGHGLPVGLGIAKAGKIRDEDFRVFVVVGDGELNEGSVWEAAMLAPTLGCDNLCVIVDFNRWQATGRSAEITSLTPIADKWRAFGWHALDVDGHDLNALTAALSAVPNATGKPTAIVAHTTKGKGVSFMEDDNNWHYRLCDEATLMASLKELGLQ